MSDKPIPFLAPMVRALLAGTKTQTRRALGLRGHKSFTEFGASDTKGYDWHFRDVGMRWHDLRDAELKARLRITVGDRLYVREHWRTTNVLDGIAPRYLKATEDATINYTPVQYEADGATVHFNAAHDPGFGRFRQGMHMPRWASRITLIVTDVRVQRLQDISDVDAYAEGIPSDDDYAGSFAKEYCPICGGSGVHGAFGAGYGVTEVDCADCETARLRYRNLWNHINGADAWEANPWVARYSFLVHHGNIDQIGGGA